MSARVGSRSAMTLVGCGRMGLALLRGWLAHSTDRSPIQVIDRSPSAELLDMARSTGIRLVSETDAMPAEVVVLAIKPQSFHSACWPKELLADGGLVLSVMAGIRLARLRASFPSAASAIRAMPNLAASVAQSATALVACEDCQAHHRSTAERLLGAVGTVEWLESEELVDAATALSGSGPAYAFYLAECLAEAGARLGLPPSTAARLARATLQGAGAVLAGRLDDPGSMRREVTSPEGTTEAALAALTQGDRFGSAVRDAVLAAAQRSRELGAARPLGDPGRGVAGGGA